MAVARRAPAINVPDGRGGGAATSLARCLAEPKQEDPQGPPSVGIASLAGCVIAAPASDVPIPATDLAALIAAALSSPRDALGPASATVLEGVPAEGAGEGSDMPPAAGATPTEGGPDAAAVSAEDGIAGGQSGEEPTDDGGAPESDAAAAPPEPVAAPASDAAAAPPEPVGAPAESGPLTPFEQGILDLVNGARSAAGLPPLSLDPRLVASARGHASDMAAMGSCRHTGSDGSRARARIVRAGYPASNWAGENIRCSADSPSDAVAWWMRSAPHRRNILHVHFTHIGVGVDPNGPWGAWCALNFAAGAE